MAAAVRRSLRQAPLDAPALRDLGLVEADSGRLESALVLMRLAHQLSRHDLATLLWSIYGSALAGEAKATLQFCDEALTIDEDLGSTLFPRLSAMSSDPISRRELVPYLRDDRPWMPAFLHYAIAATDASPGIASLIMSSRGLPRTWRYDGVDGQLLGQLAEQRQFAAASGYLRSAAGAGGDIGQDVRVTSRTLDPKLGPFAWTFVDQPEFGASVGEGGVISVRAAADQQGIAMRRILLLPKGNYVFAHRVGSSSQIARADASWQMSCLGSARSSEWKQTIAAGSASTVFRSFFTIPADCPAQQLSLLVGSNDNQGEAQLVLSGFTLARR